MSDNTTVGAVTITPLNGGYYELSHPSLPEPIKERGKEKAEQRAQQINEQFSVEEGTIPPQAPITPDAPPPLPMTDDQARSAGLLPAGEPAPTPPRPVFDDEGNEIDPADVKPKVAQSDPDAPTDTGPSEKEELKRLRARVAELEKAGIQTVMTEGGGEDDVSPMQAQKLIPQNYAGAMDSRTRALFDKLGVKIRTIILEENEQIPPTGLFISHNFRPYVIKPGEKVDVPEFLLDVLRHAVTSTPIQDSSSLKVLGYRDRMRYPFRLAED